MPETMEGALRASASAAAVAADDVISSNPGLHSQPGEHEATVRAGQHAERYQQCRLLRDIFSNVFRPPPAVEPAWLSWGGGTVSRLAQAAYDKRQRPSGHLDPARLLVLADALEEAGCADAELPGHLRGPGPHVRGCWVLDLLLGRR
jgi:hypothetical protein